MLKKEKAYPQGDAKIFTNGTKTGHNDSNIVLGKDLMISNDAYDLLLKAREFHTQKKWRKYLTLMYEPSDDGKLAKQFRLHISWIQSVKGFSR